MILKKIELNFFRNFDKAVFYFNPFLTIVIGKNSVGKTNLLEAIFFICHGNGFRDQNQEELVQSGKNRMDVDAEFGEESEKTLLKIALTVKDEITKVYLVNKIKKRAHDYLISCPPAVTFSPSFMYLIEGSPSSRRSFFDNIISSIDSEYRKRLTAYENGLKKRNKILEKAKDIEHLAEELLFWDEYLIKEAEYIVKKRDELIAFLNSNQKLDTKFFSIKYSKNIISTKTLQDTFKRQFYLKKTLVGPQRDMYEIYLKDKEEEKNIHKFGSRSEQRLALFWIVVTEIKLYEEKLKKRPLVLLDDVFSELDLTNKALILKLIKNYQTVVTTTEREILDLLTMPHTIINL